MCMEWPQQSGEVGSIRASWHMSYRSYIAENFWGRKNFSLFLTWDYFFFYENMPSYSWKIVQGKGAASRLDMWCHILYSYWNGFWKMMTVAFPLVVPFKSKTGNKICQIISHSTICSSSFPSWLKPQNCKLHLRDFLVSLCLLNLCENGVFKYFPDKTGFWSIHWMSDLQC